MDTYYDRLNAFFRYNAAHPLPHDDQLVMLHLLHRNNQIDNAGSFYLTDAMLAECTQIARSKITAIKRRLKNLKLIDFKTNPKSPADGTKYTLPPLKKPEKPKAKTDYLSVNSDKVKHAWRVSAGENLTGNKALVMIQLENVYGTEAVVDAIGKAELSNTAPRLTVNYVKAILENKKGESRHAGQNPKPNATVKPAGRIDDADHNIPPEYRYIIAGTPAN